MIKRVMIRLCGYLFGLSVCVLHILLCYLLLGWVTTLVVMGVQLLIAAGFIYIRIRAPDYGRHQSVQLHFIGPCLSDGICVSLKDKSKMIKCNVTVCGTIGRNASARTNKEGNSFLSFPLRVTIPDRDGQNEVIEISVSKDGSQEETSGYRNGSHVEITGTLFLKRRGDKLYFNLFADRIDPVASDTADFLKGDMAFRGKVGKNIEERKDRNDKPYTMFSAFSIKKVDENFEYQWVRFFCFDRQREEWLQPGVKVEAKGELTVSVHNGKPDISCRVEELMQYVPESDNSNQ